jgi:hypothetical protein
LAEKSVDALKNSDKINKNELVFFGEFRSSFVAVLGRPQLAAPAIAARLTYSQQHVSSQ